MIDRAIGIAGLGLAIVSLVFATVFPVINKKIAVGGLVLGILLMGAATGVVLLPDGNAESPPAVNQGPGSAYSYGQQGGITAGTVNVAPSRAVFTSQLGKDLLTDMPAKKLVVLRTVGGAADQKVGDDVQNFLEHNGYTVRRELIGTLTPTPDHPFSFAENPNEYIVTVASSVH
jgi:hypothetical protein